MRLFVALLMSVVVVLGQVHTCQASYVLPDGRKCQKCPSQAFASRNDSDDLKQLANDCRTCCTLKGCDRHGRPKPAPVQSQSFAIAVLPCKPLTIVVPVAPPVASTYCELAACLPNGPPGEKSSRAPPTD